MNLDVLKQFTCSSISTSTYDRNGVHPLCEHVFVTCAMYHKQVWHTMSIFI